MNQVNQDPVPITVLGLGGAGCRTVGALAKMAPEGSLRLLAVDTDSRSLDDLPLPPEQKLLAAA
ncbi:MAG: hypothetical protein J6R85_06835, partial [Lentisphaeria bacterium]|nr:hypothetical protein [Lentisphaeria bacterium]